MPRDSDRPDSPWRTHEPPGLRGSHYTPRDELADAREIGRRLALARNVMGLSQPQVARSLDMLQSKIAKLELGQQRLQMHDAMTFCSVYHLSLVDLDPRVPFRLDRVAKPGHERGR